MQRHKSKPHSKSNFNPQKHFSSWYLLPSQTFPQCFFYHLQPDTSHDSSISSWISGKNSLISDWKVKSDTSFTLPCTNESRKLKISSHLKKYPWLMLKKKQKNWRFYNKQYFKVKSNRWQRSICKSQKARQTLSKKWSVNK